MAACQAKRPRPDRLRLKTCLRRLCAQYHFSQRCAEQGEKLAAKLRAAFGVHPHVGEIRGRGLFLALELVRDRATKEPFEPARRLAARIRAEGMAAGLLCYPMGGTIDGRSGDHVMLAPPFIVSDEELDLIVERLRQAIDGAIRAAA